MKETEKVKVPLLEKIHDIEKYPIERYKQSKKISKEKQEDEEKEKIVRKVEYVGWAMGVIMERQKLLGYKNFIISAKLDDIEKCKKVVDGEVKFSNKLSIFDQDFVYREPLMDNVRVLVKYM